ncbi:leucine-rich repeat-containing protein 56 isoform X1 [Dipodomys spectabilis]|uniref:leucine-rich repeat-containing protein 56 isoform X1 n=2 Tax=Dipodomys spectabilis TaxID=105255 RepID=UPI001C542798|nr:leucine-rich repeat-containing protein 56 isoform X1 [Dipodomys spectabilis]XP_042521463.1 leucine-rich repeat-containing protein 56 isoform X1 [Dipodomys spectabilis]
MWMDPAWDGSPGPLPGTVNVRVRELSWQGQHNPSPHSKGFGSHGSIHREQLMKEHLSPARLQALAQVDDLQMVRVLEMCVDTRENSLGNFGVHLPNLSQLKLSGSRLASLRDLGTSLGCLQVLWLARCGLTDLDGIGSLPALKELYVSYNNISELSPLCMLEQLEVLDLEGNSVDDLGQVRYLQLCPRLATLTLEGNLVCLRPAPGPSNKAFQGYNYRAEVRKLIPQLHTLDEIPVTHTNLPDTQKLNQDWFMVKEAIKESSLLDSLLPRLDHSPGATLRKLDPVLPLAETPPWSLSLLVPGGPLPEDLLPEDPAPGDHASNLTHGAWQVLCGNPTKGLRERRHQCQVHPPHTPSTLPHRKVSQKKGAEAPKDPLKAPGEQEDLFEPQTSPSPPSLTSGLSRTLCCHLIPSPPKYPMPPNSDHSSPGASDLPFRGRRLRALGSMGPTPVERPGLGERLATATALRALEVSSGPGPRIQGCPDTNPITDPAARPPGLCCLPHLNPIPPAHSHP